MKLENLVLERSKKTPAVNFDAKTGVLRIEGRSIPEDPDLFYRPLLLWVETYFKAPQPQTVLEMQMEYINSGSSKSIMYILQHFNTAFNSKIDCMVNWCFEDDDEAIRDLGEHFKELFKMPFKMIEVFE